MLQPSTDPPTLPGMPEPTVPCTQVLRVTVQWTSEATFTVEVPPNADPEACIYAEAARLFADPARRRTTPTSRPHILLAEPALPFLAPEAP